VPPIFDPRWEGHLMELTSSKCRTQEAVQRDRAANASLDNVRIIAERAANAWANEAIEAERREARRARAAAIARKPALPDQHPVDEDGPVGESGDRGFAQVGSSPDQGDI
jgi:hypothetical protein